MVIAYEPGDPRERQTLHIQLDHAGGGTVVLNGYNISPAVCGIEPAPMRPGRLPEVMLRIRVHEFDMELVGPRPFVPDETRDLLVRMGWTPPPEPHPETPGDPDCPNAQAHSANGGPWRYCPCGWAEATP